MALNRNFLISPDQLYYNLNKVHRAITDQYKNKDLSKKAKDLENAFNTIFQSLLTIESNISFTGVEDIPQNIIKEQYAKKMYNEIMDTLVKMLEWNKTTPLLYFNKWILGNNANLKKALFNPEVNIDNRIEAVVALIMSITQEKLNFQDFLVGQELVTVKDKLGKTFKPKQGKRDVVFNISDDGKELIFKRHATALDDKIKTNLNIIRVSGRGHSFSIKDYQDFPIGLGTARKKGYYAMLNHFIEDSNIYQATIFAVDKIVQGKLTERQMKKYDEKPYLKEEIYKHINHIRKIYELTGIGLIDEQGDLVAPVDFLLININSGNNPQIIVRCAKTLVDYFLSENDFTKPSRETSVTLNKAILGI